MKKTAIIVTLIFVASCKVADPPAQITVPSPAVTTVEREAPPATDVMPATILSVAPAVAIALASLAALIVIIVSVRMVRKAIINFTPPGVTVIKDQ